MDWLKGKKQILLHLAGALILALASVGLSPEWAKPLHDIGDAVSAGNWQAALATVGTILALLSTAAYRAFLNRKHPEAAR